MVNGVEEVLEITSRAGLFNAVHGPDALHSKGREAFFSAESHIFMSPSGNVGIGLFFEFDSF